MQKLYALTEPLSVLPPDGDALLVDALNFGKDFTSNASTRVLYPMIETADHPSSKAMLDAAMTLKPRTVVLRGMAGPPDIQQLSSRLAVREAEHECEDGGIKIIAVIGDTAESVRALLLKWPRLPRLSGLIFADKRLRSVLAGERLELKKGLPEPVKLARSLSILMANEIGVPAYEWLNSDHDNASLIEQAEHDGFNGTVLTI
jgi:citrate lyase beta subunit